MIDAGFALPPALVVLPGPRAAMADVGAARDLSRREAERLAMESPVLVTHAGLTARRLNLAAPARSAQIFDALELFAFVRPARFCAPTAVGLALAMGGAPPRAPGDQALSLQAAAERLLQELAERPWPDRDEALSTAETMQRAGWAWGDLVVQAIRGGGAVRDRWRGSGLDAWSRIPEWEEQAPPGEAASVPVRAEDARKRLDELRDRQGHAEARPAQADYAAEVAYVFEPREREGEPRMMLAEAGTGVGKTLGYLAPASLWAEANGQGQLWISTYTRALQRQIARESEAVFPAAEVRAKKAAVRKGRENYLCLLNFQESVQAGQLGNGDIIGLALAARWAMASKDGDMTGGDFPAWLPGLFSVQPSMQAGPTTLVDRRGECVHAACPHYRTCFVEKSLRAAKRADLVIANHALVLVQAAFDGARAARGETEDNETMSIRRLIFDEGHHLFEAADSAFSAALSGAETAELRRWIRGPESRGRRGRGLEVRLLDLLGDNEEAAGLLKDVLRAAASLPGDGWSGRISPGTGEANPIGPIEHFLVAALEQLAARSGPSDLGQECSARPALDIVRQTARAAHDALTDIEAPLLALARALEELLDDEAAELPTGDRIRIQGALRGLERRARMTLPAWRGMLQAIDENSEDDPDFVDWFEAAFLHGRVVDVAARRHWVDPTLPFHAAVLARVHGVLVTSATLADQTLADPFALAESRTGASRLPERPRTLRLMSPFDYPAHSRVFVVTDVNKSDSRQVAAAMRELFLAAGGGALGLFTAIHRLRAAYDLMAPKLAEGGLALYAQHVDPLDVGALVDIFRAEVDSCLLGTDAVRDGVDVPGRSLRLLAFDRIPWPRPDLLHKARRERFGGARYDDALARGRIAQAFGRLIRRADDRGVFVMLDAAAPSRLFSALPEGVEVRRLSLVEVLEATSTFLANG